MKFLIDTVPSGPATCDVWFNYLERNPQTTADQGKNQIIYLQKNNESHISFLNELRIFSYYSEPGEFGGDTLKNHWQQKKFDSDAVMIPVYLIHTVKSIVNIFPLDQYLAAHYERQMLEIIPHFSRDEIDWLNYHCLIEDPDVNEDLGENIKKFLKFQRKLYLHYERVD